jgi:hypothetical protein
MTRSSSPGSGRCQNRERDDLDRDPGSDVGDWVRERKLKAKLGVYGADGELLDSSKEFTVSFPN